MRWNKLLFLYCLLAIIWGCEDPEFVDNLDNYEYGGQISYIEKIYADKVSVEESLNVTRIYLPLSEAHANKFTEWGALDPDDPATDTMWVDPNDALWEGEGGDNGYIGYGENYLPVDLPTFHSSKSDAYDGIISMTDFLTDEDGRVSLFMRVYPDDHPWHRYHPGDNFIIRCVIGDTAYYSDIVYSWKKMRIEYDYMEGCTLSAVGLTALKRVYNGENIYTGGSIDFNHRTYLEFKDESTYFFRSDTNLNRETWDFNNIQYDVGSFWALNRSNSDNYPLYHVGACSLENVPRTKEIFGIAICSVTDTSYDYWFSSVFVSKIMNYFSSELNSWQLKTIIGLVSSHELGHFIAKLEEAYDGTGYEHVDSLHCIMCSATQMSQNLRDEENMFFCPACIFRFRGNMYIGGPQALAKRGEK